MIELKAAFNLKTNVLDFLREKREGTQLTPDDINILNQEKDGTILYSWNDLTSDNEKQRTTHVGLYETSTGVNRVLWIYTKKIKMVSCSINQDRTLLAFTEYSTVTGHSKKKSGIYSAYLAELQGMSARVFSLNLERPNFIKVQFLYCTQTSAKESHVIVMIHKESIGLYHIPLGRVGDKGAIMCEQPKTEQLVRRFVWSQWDAQTQRLHYIHYHHHGDREEVMQVEPVLSSIQFSQNAAHSQMIDMPISGPFPYIRSSGRSHYSHNVLHDGIPDCSVNVRVLVNSNGTFCLCYQHLLSHSHAFIEDVTSSQESHVRRPRKHSSSSQSDGLPLVNELNYYIYVVHHAKILHGHVSLVNSEAQAEPKVNFVWQGDYLMVFYPGLFLHFLNVGIEFDLCHHILLQSKTYINLERSSSQQKEAGLTLHVSEDRHLSDQHLSVDDSEREMKDRQKARVVYTKDIRQSESLLLPEAGSLSHLSMKCITGIPSMLGQSCLLDCKCGMLWSPVIDTTVLVHVFSHSYTASTRSAILHYALLRTRDFELVRKLFDVLSNDIASDEVLVLMGEFLTASTYSNMRRQFDKDVCRLLPVTLCEPMRGPVEKNEDGQLLARISYSSIKNVNIGTKTAKERHQHQWNTTEDLWDALRRHLRLKNLRHKQRFSQDIVHKAYQLLQKEKKNKTSVPVAHKDEEDSTFFIRIHRRVNSSHSPEISEDTGKQQVHSDTVLKTVPAFLLANKVAEQTEETLTLTKELLSSHLVRYLKKESKVRAVNVAKEYVICQIQQSHQLCHLLWSLRGPLLPYTSHGLLPNLQAPKSMEEYELFQLLEQYYMAVTKFEYPIPQGFNSYFSALGFRSLDPIVFIQYLERGVFHLTREFVEEALSDLPDDAEGSIMKHQIISRLPLKLARECHQQWNHPLCNKYLAYSQVTEILRGKVESHSGQDIFPPYITENSQLLNSRDSQMGSLTSIVESTSFPPLTSFLKMLEQSAVHQTSQMAKRTHGNQSFLDIRFLEEIALNYTSSETPCDMSTVNF